MNNPSDTIGASVPNAVSYVPRSLIARKSLPRPVASRVSSKPAEAPSVRPSYDPGLERLMRHRSQVRRRQSAPRPRLEPYDLD